MLDPALAWQKALVATLRGFTAAGQNVFDTVPSASPFPRITIGPGQSVGNRIGCYEGTESFLDIDVWSRGPGYPEAKTIEGQVRDLLEDQILPLDGHVCELVEFRDAVFQRDPDGITSRARITIRALSQPAG